MKGQMVAVEQASSAKSAGSNFRGRGRQVRDFLRGGLERELTTGLLAKRRQLSADRYRHIGVKEIERLIKKLELDKEILADREGDTNEEPAN